MPSRTLSAKEQEEELASIVQVTLDNFSMAWRIAEMLMTYSAARLPPPSATVLFRGAGPPARVSGENCGFFTTPVINMAALNCRRSLEFFGLTCDHQTNQLRPIRSRRNPDDLGIESFGLQQVSRAQFIAAVSTVVPSRAELRVIQMHKWSNKQLAHFTMSAPTVTLPGVRDVSKLMIEAYFALLFDALGRSRPILNPS